MLKISNMGLIKLCSSHSLPILNIRTITDCEGKIQQEICEKYAFTKYCLLLLLVQITSAC